MKIEGKLTKVIAKEIGTSKAGKDWSKQSIVVEQNGTYPKSVCVELSGKALEYFEKNPIKVGGSLECEVNVESREYNGRYYTSVNAWKVSNLNNGSAQSEPQSEPQNEPFEKNDLPF